MPMPGTPPPDAPVESTPSSADSGQPSLWRRILAGGLLGSAAGMAQKNPAAAPFAAVQAVSQDQQRQFENQRQQEADQRAQTAQQQQQQQIDIEKQNAATQKTLSDANAALALTHKMLIEKQMQQLPDEQRTKISEAWSHITAAYKNSGLTMATEIDDTNEARAAYLDQVKQSGGKLTDFIFSPDPTNNKIAVFQRDDSKLLDKDNAKSISSATGINIPAGTPVAMADVILSHKMSEDTSVKLAKIQRDTEMAKNAANNETALKVAGIRAGSQGFKEVNKYVEAARGIDDQVRSADDIMAQIKATGKITGPQSAQLMSLHLANTFGQVKGLRGGMQLLQYHLKARDLPSDLEAMANRVVNGGSITMQQAQEWTSYMHETQTNKWRSAQDEAQRQGVPLQVPAYVKGLSGGGATDGLIHMKRAGRDYFVPQDKVADAEKLGATKVTQ